MQDVFTKVNLTEPYDIVEGFTIFPSLVSPDLFYYYPKPRVARTKEGRLVFRLFSYAMAERIYPRVPTGSSTARTFISSMMVPNLIHSSRIGISSKTPSERCVLLHSSQALVNQVIPLFLIRVFSKKDVLLHVR